MYARAKEIGFEVLADEIIDLADAEVNTDKDQLRRHQLMIDTRKWLLAKLQPRKYGERVTQEIVGDASNPVQVEQHTRMSIEDYKNARREMLEEDDC